MKPTLAPLMALLFAASCASTAVNPGAGAHPSAAQQEAAANAEEREADKHLASFDPNLVALREHCLAPGPDTARGVGECWRSRTNPTQAQLDEARVHERAAAEHRAASQKLRDAEVRACSGLSDHDRDVSPFAHRSDIVRVTQLPNGAIVVFGPVPWLNVAGLQKIVDCHLARNDALGHQVPWMLYCPLVPRDVTAKVTQDNDGLAVRIESTDPDAAREVKYRVGALITPAVSAR